MLKAILLRKATDDVQFWSMKGIHTCRVVSVYDGDTVNVVTVGPAPRFNLRKWRVRMAGYDSPELRPPRNMPERTKHVEAARRARDALSDIVLNKNVQMHVQGTDKYGRLLAIMYVKGVAQSVNDSMLAGGHGYAYTGGTKEI